MLTAEWSTFRTTPWMMPLLVDLSDWRTKLAQIEDSVYNSTQLLDVVFVADFPGELPLDFFRHAPACGSAKQVMTCLTKCDLLIRPLVADRSAKQVISHLTKCDLLIRPLVADVLHSVSVQHRALLCCLVRPACVCC